MAEDPESFTKGFITWDDPAFRGKKRQLDKSLGDVRGGNARSGLPHTAAKARDTAANPKNNPATREKAEKFAATAQDMYDAGETTDFPTTVAHIAGQFDKVFHAGVDRGIADGGGTGGAAWYFNMNRQQRAHVEEGSLSSRQMTAMGGRLSAGKDPEDESASLGGISRLVGSQSGKRVGERLVSDIPSAELGMMASNASSWNSHQEGAKKKAPSVPQPDFGGDDDLRQAMVHAGRAHVANVSSAIEIARGEVQPHEVYNPSTTPKTSAYAEMQFQSSGANEEADARSISAHYAGVREGTISKDQGMLMFSQEQPGERSYALRPDSPVAIDTWMIAAGSGQPLRSKRTSTDSIGRVSSKTYSPAKRLTDKGFPLDPTAYGKERLGLPSEPRITPQAAVSAQHNEAIQRVSSKIGSVSFDQFGQDVMLPSSLVQEVVWTEAKRSSGFDKAWNTSQNEKAASERDIAKAAAKKEKADAKNSPTLF